MPTVRIQVGGAAQPGVNAVAEQPNAALPGQGAADQAHQANGQPAEGQNRLRMLNFGPLRIGFGAGRGDLVNDLAQQIHNEQARPAQAANDDRAQQYGFGFGFGRPRAPQRTRSATANVHSQLSSIEQRLQQDISELRMAANELHVVRMLEAELNRLRTLRQATTVQPGTTVPATSQTALLNALAAPPVARPPQALVANAQQPVLTAGSEGLPEGLSLPPGWSMMPLQRFDGLPQTMQFSFGGMQPMPLPPHVGQLPQNGQVQFFGPRQDSPGNAASISAPPQSPIPQQTTNITTDSATQPVDTSSTFIQSAPDQTAPSSHPRTSDPVASLFSGDVFDRPRPTNAASERPTSNGAEHARPTATSGQQDPTITLPSLPSWGSNAPLAAPVPAHPSTIPETEISASSADKPTIANNNAAPVDNGVNGEFAAQPAASASPSEGKEKTATVEDYIEDVD